MITIKDVKFNVSSDTLPYTYTFSHNASCNITFSNPTGQSSESIVATDITFENEACFTGTTVTLTVNTSNICSQTFNATLTNPCAWTATIGPIQKVKTLTYLAPTPQVNSQIKYAWNYNLSRFSRLNGEDPFGKTLTLIKANPEDSSPINLNVGIVDLQSGCEHTLTFIDSPCQPTLTSLTQSYTGHGAYVLTLTGTPCDSSAIDWSTLEVAPNAQLQDKLISYGPSGGSTINVSFNTATPSGTYIFAARVANTAGVLSDWTNYTLNYTSTSQAPTASLGSLTKNVLNPGTIYNWPYYESLGDFTGPIDSVIITSPPAYGTASISQQNSDSFTIQYQADDYSNPTDTLSIKLGYQNQYTAAQTITINKVTLEFRSVVEDTPPGCTNNKHGVRVQFDYTSPVATQIKVLAAGSTHIENVPIYTSPGTATRLAILPDVPCNAGIIPIELHQIGSPFNSVKQNYTTRTEIPREINFSATLTQNSGCTYNLNVTGDYSDIQGGHLDLLVNAVDIANIGNNGCCTCSTSMITGESGTFNCTYQVNMTALPNPLPITIRSSAEPSVTSTVNLQNLSGC